MLRRKKCHKALHHPPSGNHISRKLFWSNPDEPNIEISVREFLNLFGRKSVMKVEPGIGIGISKLAEEFDQFLRENCADKSNVEMLRLAGGGSFSGISCPSNAARIS